MANSNQDSIEQARRLEEMVRIRDLAHDCRNDGEFLARLWGLDLAMFIDDPEPCEYTEIRFVNPFGLMAGKPSKKNEQGDVE